MIAPAAIPTPATAPFSLSGHAIIVTGAGRGIGAAIALACVAAGADVLGVARSGEQLDQVGAVAEPLPGLFTPYPADLTEVDSIADSVDRLVRGRSSAWDVVHAAGVQVRAPAEQVTLDAWETVVRLNLTIPFQLSTEIARRSLSAGVPGSHLFIGSLTSTIGISNVAPYAAAKSGLLGLARTLAIEWAKSDLRANVLCPGYFHTELTDAVFQDEARRDWILSRIPMGKAGEPGDIGPTAVYFLSDASRYVTGQSLTVDGGWLAA